MQYRRAKIEGGSYFFTVVTYARKKFLCEAVNIQLLKESFKQNKSSRVAKAILGTSDT